MRRRKKVAVPVEPASAVEIDAVLRRYAKDHPQPVKSNDSAGVLAWNSDQQAREHPAPPEHYPRSGSACYRCPGTEDPRCCQYKNQTWGVPE